MLLRYQQMGRLAKPVSAEMRPVADQAVRRIHEGVANAEAHLVQAGEQNPVVVEVDVRELSSAAWVARFPTSRSTDDLASPFRENCVAFLAVLRAANANVVVSATLRPPNRAYLMHWAWRIVNQQYDPRTAPRRAGVEVRWDHIGAGGEYDPVASVAAARDMVNGYGIGRLRVAPSLTSRHIEGNAIDMSISWEGNLDIEDVSGNQVLISTQPRDGMNEDLHSVGAGYGVIKFHGGARDRPHWSTDGR